MIKYYSEEELQIRIREIRDSKEYLTKREDELILFYGQIAGTGGLISERGVVQKPKKEAMVIPRHLTSDSFRV